MNKIPVANIVPKKFDRLDYNSFQEEYDHDIMCLYNNLKNKFPNFIKKLEYKYFLQFVYKEYLRI